MKNRKAITWIVGLALTFAIAAVIICCAVRSCSSDLGFSAVYYYVLYECPSDAHSVASVATTVRSYGGAGYIIENGGEYFVTVSCYYSESDAQSVCANLNHKGLPCTVKKAERSDFPLASSENGNREKYRGNLNTLHSLSVLCYDLANDMDGNVRTQAEAKSLLEEVKTGLESLYRQNGSNCFTGEISALLAEYGDVAEGYLYSYDVRRLQIAITDCIMHVKLY